MPTANIDLLKKRLKRLKRKFTRQEPGSNGSAKTEELIQKTALRIKHLNEVQPHD
jgi:hypothetical protein